MAKYYHRMGAAREFFVGILALAIWWQMYRYHDCKMVGHSTLYCVMDLGSK